MKYLVSWIYLVFIAGTYAVDKKWMADTNFDNPKNWYPQRVPCGNDVVILPTSTPVIYVQVNTTIKELILPLNGELIFGQDINIGFTDQIQPDCKSSGGEVDFDAVHPESWLNVNNWCSSSNESGACDPKPSVLDVERVPCTYDTVIFPRDHLYFVDLTEKFSVSIRSFKYQRATFTSTDELSKYFNSTDGRKLFQTLNGTSPITIDRGQRCKYSTGCPCGNDKPDIATLICKYVSCKRARCTNVIRPVGACCNLCGVLFNITAGDGFILQTFTTDIRNQFLQPGTDDVISLATSITSDNWIQLVLTDTTGEKSLALGKEIEKAFQQDVQDGGHKFSIDAFTMTSGSPVKPSAQQSLQELKPSVITGIAVAVIGVFLAVVFFVLCFLFKGQGRRITMPRLRDFPQLPGFHRRVMRPTAHVMPHTAPHVDPGFANPLYDTAPLDDGNVVFKEMKVMNLSDDVATFDAPYRGFHNPLFGVDQLKTGASADEGDVAVTSASGSPLSVNIKHQPKDSSI